ncbi:MAG: chromate transporter [Oscillospiraceae bacterium]|nr:chromate transporter [Oscillospiraceae bacterium]
MKKLIKIYLTFARIGVFTFGGGYSMLPMFQRDLVEKNHWLTEAELTDFFAVSQCLPGIIAVNTSTFAGHKHGGRSGGIAAALGMISPSIIIILIIAAFITRFSEIPAVQYAFAGIRVCVCVLIVNAIVKLWKSAIVDKSSLVVYAAVFAISVFTSIPVAILVVAAGIAGISIKAIKKAGKKT